jgi:hypothetical protein
MYINTYIYVSICVCDLHCAFSIDYWLRKWLPIIILSICCTWWSIALVLEYQERVELFRFASAECFGGCFEHVCLCVCVCVFMFRTPSTNTWSKSSRNLKCGLMKVTIFYAGLSVEAILLSGCLSRRKLGTQYFYFQPVESLTLYCYLIQYLARKVTCLCLRSCVSPVWSTNQNVTRNIFGSGPTLSEKFKGNVLK